MRFSRLISMFLLLQGLYVDVYGATKVEPGPNSKSLETTHSVLAQQLRDLASTNLEKSYLNDDMYVEWFLKRANYVPEEAHRLLQEHLQWRDSEKLDVILEEDWSSMKARFPYTRNTFTKNGGPVLYIDLGQWDLSSYLSEKTFNELIRYFIMIFEESNQHVKKLHTDGNHDSKAFLLVNLGDYSFSKHMCYQCLFFYRDVSTVLYSQMASAFQDAILVNVPFLFKTAFSMLGEGPQQYVVMYGQDQDAWKSGLEKFMDEDQFPEGLLSGKPLSGEENSDGLLSWMNKEL